MSWLSCPFDSKRRNVRRRRRWISFSSLRYSPLGSWRSIGRGWCWVFAVECTSWQHSGLGLVHTRPMLTFICGIFIINERRPPVISFSLSLFLCLLWCIKSILRFYKTTMRRIRNTESNSWHGKQFIGYSHGRKSKGQATKSRTDDCYRFLSAEIITKSFSVLTDEPSRTRILLAIDQIV